MCSTRVSIYVIYSGSRSCTGPTGQAAGSSSWNRQPRQPYLPTSRSFSHGPLLGATRDGPVLSVLRTSQRNRCTWAATSQHPKPPRAKPFPSVLKVARLLGPMVRLLVLLDSHDIQRLHNGLATKIKATIAANPDSSSQFAYLAKRARN